MTQATGCPVVRAGKGLSTGAINVLSAQKTQRNVSSFAKCALFRHFSSFGVRPVYSSTARLSPPLARNSGQRARLFSVCLSSARSPSQVALNEHQAGQTEDGTEEVSPLITKAFSVGTKEEDMILGRKTPEGK